MDGVRVRCAAKVNLCLEIVRRRPDGYHDLRSLMTAVSLWDEVLLEPAPNFCAFSGDGTPLSEQNTVWRAAILLAQIVQRPLQVKLTLTKRIPEQSGLGGASSDGAAVLFALRRLWRLRWSWKKFVPIAAKVGADVPFFLAPTGAAVVEGIGDRLTPVRLPPLWLVLAKPEQGMPTQLAFALWDEKPTRVATDPFTLAEALRRGDWDTVRTLAVNAFESVIAPRISAVAELKQQLVAAGAVTAVMSGSGTTVVGVFADRKSAQRGLEVVQPIATWCALVHTVRESLRLRAW